MKKALALVMFLGMFLVSSNVFAAESQYTIEGIWQNLDPEGPPSFSIINDYNDSGYAVGRLSQYPGQFGRPFWWHEGSFQPINVLSQPLGWGPGGMEGGALDINNSNQFVGWALGPHVAHPVSGNAIRQYQTFFVDNGNATLISDFRAYSVDENGAVYGDRTLSGYGPLIDDMGSATWKDGNFIEPSTNAEVTTHSNASTRTNLKDLLAPGYDPLWQDLVALYETDSGLIVGNGTYSFGDGSLIISRAFYMTPTVTPEPATMALFGIGGAALAARRLKRKKAK